MSKNFEFIDNSDKVISALKVGAERALKACGLQAEGYAKPLAPTDTGLLKNSITHAISGEAPAISHYEDKAHEQHGTYSGNAPDDGNNKAVYIGTNVPYAVYQEYGTQKTTAHPFLKPAIANHADEYKRIIANFLSGKK